jgi:hypothetical protein
MASEPRSVVLWHRVSEARERPRLLDPTRHPQKGSARDFRVCASKIFAKFKTAFRPVVVRAKHAWE